MTPTHDQKIKAESFIFRELAAPVDKKKATRRRRDLRNARSFHSQPILCTQADLDRIEQDSNDAVSSAQRATVLENVHVYIDKTLYNDRRIAAMATSLGATVAETLDSSVTHVIHGPSQQHQQQQQCAFGLNSNNNNNNNANKLRHPRLVMQALDRGMRVVSPTWIFECYEQKRRLPEQFYPYNVDTSCRLSYHQPHVRRHRRDSNTNDNVFGLAQSEIASSDTDDDDDKTDDGHSGLGRHEEMDEHIDVEDQDERKERYNEPISSAMSTAEPAVASLSEDKARLEKRMKRTAEIAKLKEQRKRQRQPDSDQEENTDDLDHDSPPFPEGDGMRNALLAGRERVEIWYGEQSFYHDHTGLAAAAGPSNTIAGATSSRRSGQQRGLSLNNKNKGKQ